MTNTPSPENASINPFDLVKAQHGSGQVKEAVENYRKILEREPDYLPALNMLGNALMDLGDFEGAIAEYRRALEIEPENISAHYNIGNALTELGRADEAAEAYRRSLEFKPDFGEAHHNLGNVLLDMEHPAEAIVAFEHALEHLPEDHATHFNLGKALDAVDRQDEALQAMERALELNDKFLQAASEIGHILVRRGDPMRALAYFKKALRIDPEAASELFNIAMACFVLGRQAESEKNFKRALEKDPKNGRIFECYGRLLLQMERKDEAIELLNQWIKVDPDNPRARHFESAWISPKSAPRASDDYVREEFDRFAADFDSTLKLLDYRVPTIIAETLIGRGFDDQAGASIADVGCGTGLCGPLLRTMAERLVGIDLSEQMLNKARDRDVYDELVNLELTEYLLAQTDRFDVIVSADTFVYFGVLEDVFLASAQALKSNGTLVFTTELIEDGDENEQYQLETTGRYRHARAYLEQSISDAGLTMHSAESVVLRTEGGAPVQGVVVVATKTT